MEDLIGNTIRKIEEQRMRPDPLWRYIVKKYSFWMLFAILAVVGAVAFSIGSHLVFDLDWDLYRFQRQSMLWFFISTTPIFWAAAIVLLIFAAYLDILKSEKGYRYGMLRILAVAVFSIIALGLIFSGIGLGKRANQSLEKNIPQYSKIVMTKRAQWSQPEKGFLAGTIKREGDDSMDLQDLTGRDWTIETNEDTSVKPSVKLRAGEEIKVIGKNQGNQVFQAHEIRPWSGRGKGDGLGAGVQCRQNGLESGRNGEN
jgi:hypothetical protein